MALPDWYRNDAGETYRTGDAGTCRCYTGPVYTSCRSCDGTGCVVRTEITQDRLGRPLPTTQKIPCPHCRGQGLLVAYR